MSIELKGELFFAPSRLFTDLEDPASRERFKGLMQFQYGFSDEEVDRAVAHLRKQEYWKKRAPDVMAVVINEKSKRAFQVGSLVGYNLGRFYITFMDSIIEAMGEEEIAFIEKSEISPEVKIKVEFLDENWQETVREGELVGYEKVEDRKGGEPYGTYVIQVNGEAQGIKDWGMFTAGAFRFLVKPPGSETNAHAFP